MKFIASIPLFAYLLLIYDVVATAGKNTPGFGLDAPVLTHVIPSSGAMFSFNVAELLVMVGVGALYIEIYKATRTSTSSIIDHLFSLLVFVAFLVEFLLLPMAATPAFLILTLMSFLDVVAGFTVTISTARRDLSMGHGGHDG